MHSPRARRPKLVLLHGGKSDEDRTVRRLYPYEKRQVRSEPQPPTPPRAA